MSAIVPTNAVTCNASNFAPTGATAPTTAELLAAPAGNGSVDDILVMIQMLNTKAGAQQTQAQENQASP